MRAALAMRAAIRDYNQELADEGLPPLAVGIGINRGAGLAGLVGSRERREYAFVRPTVKHQVDILVTESVREHLDPKFVLTPMPAESVKGIAEPVVTFAVRE